MSLFKFTIVDVSIHVLGSWCTKMTPGYTLKLYNGFQKGTSSWVVAITNLECYMSYYFSFGPEST